MRSRFPWRAGAAVVGASATALMLTALPAHADPASGDLKPGEGIAGYAVNLKGRSTLETNLMRLQLDNQQSSMLQVYCVEIDETADPSRQMVERPWDAYPNPESPFHNAANRHKINWILHNAVPVIKPKDLGAAVVAHGKTLSDNLSKKEAITATQAAIWHFSDDEKLKQDNPTEAGEKFDHDVWVTYEYLTSDANTGISKQPAPALKIEPSETKGVAGKLIGPITVTSNGEVTAEAKGFPKGTKLVDAEGKELDPSEVLSGAESFIKVPADVEAGQGSFTLTAGTEIATGRLFVAEDYAKEAAQSLIVASSDKTTLTETAKVSWTAATPLTTAPTETTPPADSTVPPSTSESAPVAAPSTTEASPVANTETEELAYTGASVLTPALIGVGLLGAGAAALIFVRRRKQV